MHKSLLHLVHHTRRVTLPCNSTFERGCNQNARRKTRQPQRGLSVRMGHATDAAVVDENTANTSLPSLITKCISEPKCLYSMSAEITKPRLTHWLRAAAPRTILPIWVWVHYPYGMPQYIQMNLRALAMHAPTNLFRIHMLNASSLSTWITLPPEFDRLRSTVAASDVARMGLLAKYGGMYVDADVLVTSSLSRVSRLLDEHEMVVYSAPGQDCRAGVFSPNFVATRPNSTVWTAAWHDLHRHLKLKCGGKRRAKLCCYDANRKPITCRSPWGLTDYIVRPIATKLATEMSFSAYCMGFKEGLTPMGFAHASQFTPAESTCLNYLHIYTTPLTIRPGEKRRVVFDQNASDAAELWSCATCVSHHVNHGPNSTLCCRRRGVHLTCKNPRGYVANAGFFFNRLAYHLFESINGPEFERHPRIEDSNLTVSMLYRRAFGMPH